MVSIGQIKTGARNHNAYERVERRVVMASVKPMRGNEDTTGEHFAS
jgi:hypothetical protein